MLLGSRQTSDELDQCVLYHCVLHSQCLSTGFPTVDDPVETDAQLGIGAAHDDREARHFDKTVEK